MNPGWHNEPPIRAEIDSMPVSLFENARDWSDLAVTRLLAQPLFEERPDRKLESTLVSSCKRISEHIWNLTLSEQARWNSGKPITGEDVCRQIVRARQAKAAPLSAALMVKSMKVESSNTITVETRIPVAHLDRVFANPGLAPRSTADSSTSGAYILKSRSANRLSLSPSQFGRPLDLICASRDEADAFDSGKVDVTGPISANPRHWLAVSRSKTAQIYPLDIVYVMILPKWLSALNRRELHARLDREKISRAANGSVFPCCYMTDLWTKNEKSIPNESAALGSDLKIPGKIHLFYTAFPGNFEVAQETARELLEKFQIPASIAPCEYSEFISASSDEYENAFRVALVSSLWPHPIGMLAPFFFGAEASVAFKDAFLAAANADDLTAAARCAASAENVLVEEGTRVITLGRVNGCVRSRHGTLWCPPSGWMDYFQLNNG